MFLTCVNTFTIPWGNGQLHTKGMNILSRMNFTGLQRPIRDSDGSIINDVTPITGYSTLYLHPNRFRTIIINIICIPLSPLSQFFYEVGSLDIHSMHLGTSRKLVFNPVASDYVCIRGHVQPRIDDINYYEG